MSARERASLPPELEQLRTRAIRLQWAMLGFMTSIVVVLYFVLGNSQAMKAAWLEDLLGLVPPIAFLVAARIERLGPSNKYPFGHYRAISISFLISSVALLGMGLFLLYDSVSKLIARDHPTIASVEMFGFELWQGWLMIAALAYSMVPPVVIGRMTLPLASKLHDKALYAGADMAKADWMTALAGIAGIVGIGFGLWWADAAAALFITVEILRDGGRNTWSALQDLSDQRPNLVESRKEDPIVGRLKDLVCATDWVARAEVRLREEGRFLTGVVFIEPADTTGLKERIAELAGRIKREDWRLYDIAVMPVEDISNPDGAGAVSDGWVVAQPPREPSSRNSLS